MNKFEVKGTSVEFVINNFSAQSNNFKIKGKEICRVFRLDLCETNGIVPSFHLVLSDTYSESSEISKM